MMSLPNVSPHLTIRILYSDDDVVVIEKPCDLRSVPGHAKPSPRSGGGGDADASSQSHRRTAQEAWVTAIQLMSEAYELDDIPTKSIVAIPGDIIIDNEEVSIEDSAVKELLHNLGSTANPSCVPRKMETFVKYCHRNSKRLLPSFPDLHPDKSKNSIVSKKEQCDEPTPQKKQKCDKSSKPSGKDEVSSTMRKNAQLCYAKIQQTQIPLMNLPKPTEDWESAIGQLRMMGFGDYNHCASTTANEDSGKSSDAKLHVVHRLDCQTSGIMVVARNHTAASTLSQAWRERDVVQKVYLAHVKKWAPYHQKKVTEGKIEISLAASLTERIKWEARPVAEGGKECKTYWKVYEDYDNGTTNGEEGTSQNSSVERRGITLELHPITGRTHQLRLHCAAIGSGIVGDSLYGDSPIAWFGDGNTNTNLDQKQDIDSVPKTLRLHAHRLTFPHPKSGEKVTFESPKSW